MAYIRFRYTGINYLLKRWRTSKPITTLGTQIESSIPERHGADGTAAGRSHSIKSDHTPDANGIVRAIDIGEHTEEGFFIAEAIRLSQDNRVKYLIHEGRMFSSYPKPGYPPYTWRPYSGSNPHSNHIHLSVLNYFDEDDRLWDIGENLMALFTVKQFQAWLNKAKRTDQDGNPLEEDGILGPKTEHAIISAFSVDPIPDISEAVREARRANKRLDDLRAAI